jgi:TrmH family RNA methyltransferase
MLDAPKSERVKGVARLQQKDARFETGLFLLEGPQGLKELAKQPELAQEVFATTAALDKYEELFDALYEADVPIIEVSDLVMDKLADTKTPQGGGRRISVRCDSG